MRKHIAKTGAQNSSNSFRSAAKLRSDQKRCKIAFRRSSYDNIPLLLINKVENIATNIANDGNIK